MFIPPKRGKNHPPVDLTSGVFTTGQVAAICHVAVRTVSKWVDSGKLVGYRVPGAKNYGFRRITRLELIRFLEKSGMDSILKGVLQASSVLFAGVAQTLVESVARGLPAYITVRSVADAFTLGVEMRNPPMFLVLDASISNRAEISRFLSSLTSSCRRVFVLLPEDETDLSSSVFAGCVVMQHPIDPHKLSEQICGAMVDE